MKAMIHTLRHYPSCSLTRAKFLQLFTSFTKAQFYKQRFSTPWTGEYYNGNTGAWKTDQRDYFHSTWLDPLISGLIGLRPRPDNLLEIYPLLPPNAWSYWILDGQAYHNHNITIAWDAKGGHFSKRFKGFGVWLDGKLIYSAPHISHILYNMHKHTLLTAVSVQGRAALQCKIHTAESKLLSSWRFLPSQAAHKHLGDTK